MRSNLQPSCIDLVDRPADHILLLEPGQFEEALVHSAEPQVREPAYDGRGRVGPEHSLESLLGLEQLGVVPDQQA